MNFYQRHIGDWIKNTIGLSMVEDGAYNRLIDYYYSKEKEIPLKKSDIFQISRATSKLERDAVLKVLSEFFTLTPTGYSHMRCDEEIEKYQESQEGSESKKENDRERQKRARARRASLFEQLREHGIVPAFDTKTPDLQTLLSQASDVGFNENVTQPVTYYVTENVTQPVTRDNTANQNPESRIQSINTASTDVLAPAFPDEKPQQPEALGSSKPKVPDCPHLDVLQLWAEILPAMPQHNPDMWRGTRADHLRARWRETAAAKKWQTQADGLAYFRKFFAFVGKSPFLTGQTRSTDPSKRPFTVELEWLVNPTNWAKAHEGKYHTEA